MVVKARDTVTYGKSHANLAAEEPSLLRRPVPIVVEIPVDRNLCRLHPPMTRTGIVADLLRFASNPPSCEAVLRAVPRRVFRSGTGSSPCLGGLKGGARATSRDDRHTEMETALAERTGQPGSFLLFGCPVGQENTNKLGHNAMIRKIITSPI
jgi:hypothetical protein